MIQCEPEVYQAIENVTARGALEKMNCTDQACRQGVHMWAGFAIFKNTPVSRKFVKQWLDYCSDETIIKGLRVEQEEFKEFKSHMDDQAVLSVVAHQLPESLYIISREEAISFLAWHHRHPNNAFKSLLPYLDKGMRGWEKDFLNARWIIALKKYFFSNSPAFG